MHRRISEHEVRLGIIGSVGGEGGSHGDVGTFEEFGVGPWGGGRGRSESGGKDFEGGEDGSGDARVVRRDDLDVVLPVSFFDVRRVMSYSIRGGKMGKGSVVRAGEMAEVRRRVILCSRCPGRLMG